MVDWLLGAAFLRNVYQLYDYGDDVSQVGNLTIQDDFQSLFAKPKTQLLSVCLFHSRTELVSDDYALTLFSSHTDP